MAAVCAVPFLSSEGRASNPRSAQFGGVDFPDADGIPTPYLAEFAKKVSAELKRPCDASHTYAWTAATSSIYSRMKQIRDEHKYLDVIDQSTMSPSARAKRTPVFSGDLEIDRSDLQLTFVWINSPRAVAVCANLAAAEPNVTNPLTRPVNFPLVYVENNLANPLYQVLEGQLYGDTELQMSWASVKIRNPLTTLTATSHSNDLRAQQFFRYGVTDDLSVGVNFEYDPTSTTTIHTQTGTTTTNDPGWTDPQFQIYYMLVSDAPFFLRVGPQYSPDWVSSPQQAQFVERLGYEAEDWAAEFGETTSYDWSNSPQGGSSADWQVELDLKGFYLLSARWSVNSIVSYVISPGHSSDGAVNLLGQINYDIVPDKVQVSLEYQHRFYDAFPNRSDQSKDFAGIRLAYLFDLYEPASK